ncbi:TOBE domain-containing protein [Natrononativus amylolyticus]|uniref:TOBE domain-containing protein n=1 Tax=Natrononativus amylolyticus TaxID=2963434 RepID=UPI0020CC79BA|nr:TOBE domain-containing protein [Natrononativus amylolyticus]
MTVEKGYRTELSIDDVTVDRRDVEMFEAIDQHGSIHAAADALGRSYARLQGRIVELEGALGELTERQRGGAGGGGTELTATARRLLRRFERHQTALEGVARVTESVFTGRVVERTGELGTVETPAGRVVALVPEGATEVQIGVRSDAVVLATAPTEDDRTSFRNQFVGTVSSLESGAAIASVTLALDGGVELGTVITTASLERLGLAVGESAVASFKATAARAIPLADEPE